MTLNAVVVSVLNDIQSYINDGEYKEALELFNTRIKGKDSEKEVLEELSKNHDISFLKDEKKISQTKKQAPKEVKFKTTTIRLSTDELEFLRSVGEEEGMALVKQIEISKDRSETAQATIKRLLLELDLLN